MRTKLNLRHPVVHLGAYLLVPLVLNAICIVNMQELFPEGGTLVVRCSGVLLAFSWGWPGIFLCALLGAGLGMPIAGLQAAYLRSRLGRQSTAAPTCAPRSVPIPG